MSVKCNENENDEKKSSSGSGHTMDQKTEDERPKTKDLRPGDQWAQRHNTFPVSPPKVHRPPRKFILLQEQQPLEKTGHGHGHMLVESSQLLAKTQLEDLGIHCVCGAISSQICSFI
ncbi:GD12674 [Drosophila simulans]|uniref:GD12674 n=1 Tax=Drosophila simulans TaxID=7240 RepID=B4QIZ7_DROSI|nr:GD12674 [Drosophila simulans]